MNEILPINFTYEPSFVSSIRSLGIEVEKHPDRYVEEYARLISKDWSGVGPKLSEAFESTLHLRIGCFIENPIICHVLQSRVKVADDLFLEGNSSPLSIWAIPPDKKWEHLPFYARLAHELIHLFHNYIDRGVWKIQEDDVLSERRREMDFLLKNRFLLEELVVRKFTDKVTLYCFGQEFSDWFSTREPSVEALFRTYHRQLPPLP